MSYFYEALVAGSKNIRPDARFEPWPKTELRKLIVAEERIDESFCAPGGRLTRAQQDAAVAFWTPIFRAMAEARRPPPRRPSKPGRGRRLR